MIGYQGQKIQKSVQVWEERKMEEKSRFQMDVEVVSEALSRRGQKGGRKEGEKLYEKFSTSKQEPVRLAVALRGFFLEDGVTQEEREAYAAYLKIRIRPAMEELIQEEAVEKMEKIEALGWFGQPQLEVFIRLARSRKKTASLMWLLHLKDKKYGYQQKDFSL